MSNTELAHEAGMHNVRARRNYLVGRWAAAKMGVDSEAGRQYGSALHKADPLEQGDADILRKLAADMISHGATLDEAEITQVISECHRRGLRETFSTD